MDRRGFLKKLGLGLAAAVVAPVALAELAKSRAAETAPPKTPDAVDVVKTDYGPVMIGPAPAPAAKEKITDAKKPEWLDDKLMPAPTCPMSFSMYRYCNCPSCSYKTQMFDAQRRLAEMYNQRLFSRSVAMPSPGTITVPLTYGTMIATASAGSSTWPSWPVGLGSAAPSTTLTSPTTTTCP